MLIAFCLGTSTTFAATMSVASNSTLSTNISNLPTEKKSIVEKFKAKVEKSLTKNDAGDINIPGSTKKWLLYWVLGVVASIVIGFALPGFLWRILSAFTTIAFIIWLLKFFKILD